MKMCALSQLPGIRTLAQSELPAPFGQDFPEARALGRTESHLCRVAILSDISESIFVDL